MDVSKESISKFPIKNLLIDSLLTPIVESTYLNRDMCMFESSQRDKSRWQSTDSSKAYRNTSVFKWIDNHKPKIGPLFDIMKESKKEFKYAFKSFLEVQTKIPSRCQG